MPGVRARPVVRALSLPHRLVQRPKSDRVAAKVLHAIDEGRSYRSRCGAGIQAVHRAWNSTARTGPRGSASDGRGRGTRARGGSRSCARGFSRTPAGTPPRNAVRRQACEKRRTRIAHTARPRPPPGRRISPQDRPRAESRPVGASARRRPPDEPQRMWRVGGGTSRLVSAPSRTDSGVVAQANARGSPVHLASSKSRWCPLWRVRQHTERYAYLHAFSKDANGEMRRPDVTGIRPPRPPGEPGSTTTGASTHDCDSNLTSRGRGPANGARRRGRHRVSGYRDPIHVLVHQDAVRGVPVPVIRTNKPSDDPCHPVSRTKPDPRGVTTPAVCDTGHDQATEAPHKTFSFPLRAQRRVRAPRDPREPQDDARGSEGDGEEHPILPAARPARIRGVHAHARARVFAPLPSNATTVPPRAHLVVLKRSRTPGRHERRANSAS